MYNNLRKMKERKAADEDNFYVSGPRDLTNGHWGNERDRRIISASLVKGAYAFEQDRQKDRKGKGLAPPWSKHFGYEKIDELIDVDDGSIFAVIYKFEPQQQQLAFNNHHQCCCCCYPIQGKAPRRVIAFRGTMFKKATAKRDVRLDIKIILNLLHETSRFKIAKQAVEKIVKEVGASNVCLAGHSLGAAIAMLVGKTMGKQGYMLQGLFFNPPFVSLPIEWIKDEEIKSFIRLSKMHLTAAIAAIRGHHQLDNAFVELADWVPYLFVNANDIVCSEYVGYFEYRKAMEQIGFGDTEKLAAQNSLMNCFFSKKEGTERSHFIPFGDAAINKKPPPGFCRSHGLKVWWRPDLELEHKTYQLR